MKSFHGGGSSADRARLLHKMPPIARQPKDVPWLKGRLEAAGVAQVQELEVAGRAPVLVPVQALVPKRRSTGCRAGCPPAAQVGPALFSTSDANIDKLDFFMINQF